MSKTDSPFGRALAVVLVACVWTWAAACGSEASHSIVPAPAPAEVTAAPPAVEASAPRPLETVVPSTESTAQLEQVERAVIRLRGRGLERPVARSFVTSAGMRSVVDEELADPEVVTQIRAEGLLLEALGLIAPGTDLLESYRGLLSQQVLGLYSPEASALYVLANAQPGPLELSTYAHEYHHALQDQRFDLDAIDGATKGNRDAGLAASALIEGDATYTQSQFVAQDLGVAGALALLGAASAAPPPSAPPVLLDLLQFPYLQGTAFVQSLARRGGVAAIDAAFASVPASTEQVLHPEKYAAQELPVEVRLDVSLPDGWSAIAGGDVLGEYLLRRWLRETGLQPPSATAVAAGWGGDRYLLARAPSGGVALVARVVWDTTADADEFMVALLPGPQGDGVRVGSVGRRWVALARIDQRMIALAVAADRAGAEALGRAIATGR